MEMEMETETERRPPCLPVTRWNVAKGRHTSMAGELKDKYVMALRRDTSAFRTGFMIKYRRRAIDLVVYLGTVSTDRIVTRQTVDHRHGRARSDPESKIALLGNE